MRVTNSNTNAMLLRNIQSAQSDLNGIQGQLASNKRIQISSDDPAAADAAMSARATLRRSTQLQRNAGQANQWLTAASQATGSAVDDLTSARSLLVQASSGALDATARAGIVEQLQQIRSSLLNTAETQVSGRSIFAGTAPGAAYDASGAYTGDSGAVTMPVAPGVSIQVARTGPEVFGTANASDPTNGDVFQLLQSLSTSVQNGDTAAISAGLAKIDAATSRVQSVETELGSRESQLNSMMSAAKLKDQTVTSRISDLEDVDMAQATISLKAKQTAYEASLSVAAKILQTSLLDFLK